MSSPFDQYVRNACTAGNIFRALSPALLNRITCSVLPTVAVRGLPRFFAADHFLFSWGQQWMGRGAVQASPPVVRARVPSASEKSRDAGPVVSGVNKAGPAWQLLCELLNPASLRSVEILLTHPRPALSGQQPALGEQEINRRIHALAAYTRKFLKLGEQFDLFRGLVSLLHATPGLFEGRPQPAQEEQAGRALFAALAQWAWSFKAPLRAEMMRCVFALPAGSAMDRVAILILQFSERGQGWQALRCDLPWLFRLACQYAGQSEEGIDLIKALLGLLPPSAPGLSACLGRMACHIFHAPPACRVQIANALWSLPAGKSERLLLSLAQGLQARGELLQAREAAASQSSDARLPRGQRRERRAQVALFHWLCTQLLVLYPPGSAWQTEEEPAGMHDPYHRRPRSSVLPVLAAQVGLLPLPDREVALDVVALMNLALASGWRPQKWHQ